MVNLKNECLALAPDGDFTVYTVEQVYKDISKDINKIKSISINLLDCLKIDSAALQLLISLFKTAKEQNIAWQCEGSSKVVIDFCDFYNVTYLLEQTTNE